LDKKEAKKKRWDETTIMERRCDAGKPLCEYS
jgi:hypothetical protein